MDAFDLKILFVEFFLLSIISNVILYVLYRRVRRMAFSHELTGLPNKREMSKITKPLFAGLQRGNIHTLITVAMDLRNFKVINSKYGHSNGDEVLKVVGELLTRHTRTTDPEGHHSGDEFTLVMPIYHGEEVPKDPVLIVERVIGKVNAELRRYYFDFADGPVDTRLDIGVSVTTSIKLGERKMSVHGYGNYWDAYDDADKDCERRKNEAGYKRRNQ